MATLFSIEDKWELLAMYRALMAAKFSPESPRELPGSPFLAAVCERTVAALQEHGIGSQSPSSWAEWLQAERFPEQLAFVRQLLAECRKWPEWSLAQRQEYVRLLLSPFRASADTIAELLAYADACHPVAAV